MQKTQVDITKADNWIVFKIGTDVKLEKHRRHSNYFRVKVDSDLTETHDYYFDRLDEALATFCRSQSLIDFERSQLQSVDNNKKAE